MLGLKEVIDCYRHTRALCPCQPRCAGTANTFLGRGGLGVRVEAGSRTEHPFELGWIASDLEDCGKEKGVRKGKRELGKEKGREERKCPPVATAQLSVGSDD